MIANEPLPKGWNRQHTLYYRNWYRVDSTQKNWRDSESMIVPIRIDRHIMLHRNVLPGGVHPSLLRESMEPPKGIMPSEGLAGYGLRVSDELDGGQEIYTRFEAFTIVRNELYSLSRKRRRRALAREAGRDRKSTRLNSSH